MFPSNKALQFATTITSWNKQALLSELGPVRTKVENLRNTISSVSTITPEIVQYAIDINYMYEKLTSLVLQREREEAERARSYNE